MKTGVLLVNLGTPDAPRTASVRKFLKEFLSDPRVMDMPAFFRYLLLYSVILPFRSKKSAQAYSKIWGETGSPLMIHSQQLAEGVGRLLAEHGLVLELAMRYGEPSIQSAMTKLREQGCYRLIVVPLFPQYSSSTTGSALEEIYSIASQYWNVPSIVSVPAFYNHPGFIRSFAAIGAPFLEKKPDHVLFSFHGLPERQIHKGDRSKTHCLSNQSCCDTLIAVNSNCYRAQCMQTARLLANVLKLEEESYSVSFQSRMGRIPWIRPYTDETILDLAKEGVKKLVVFCPAFVSDCLETLEEIGIQNAEQFREAGGESLELVPSLNEHPVWTHTLAEIILSHHAHVG